MITTLTISADTAGSAREAAINQAKAQGFTNISAAFTTQVGPRQYEVQLTVT